MKSWKTPTPDQVAKAVALLGHAEHYRYFFDQLENPMWIGPLKEKGFFRDPPPLVRDSERGTTAIPPWPESRYLARMARHLSGRMEVLEIALSLPETENIRVHEDFVDSALAMPTESAALLVPIAKRWVRSQFHSLLPEKLGKLIAHLARGGQVDEALDLTRSLLEVLPDPSWTNRGSKEPELGLVPHPRAHFDVWDYHRILTNDIPELVKGSGERGLGLLCDLLDEAIRFSLPHPDNKGWEDYSFIWRPTIKGGTSEQEDDLQNVLVSAVRDASEVITRADSSQLTTVLALLDKRHWRVFQRISLHALNTIPDAAVGLVADHLTNVEILADQGCWSENAELLSNRFNLLTTEAQDKILEWVERGPDLESFRIRSHEWDGKTPTDEEVARYFNRWQRDRLAPFSTYLPEGWSRKYQELVAELGPPSEWGQPLVTSGSFFRTTSPKGAEELGAMTIGEVVSFLKEWHPPVDPLGPSAKGLGRELTAWVAAKPDRVAAEASRFRGLEPTYVRGMLSGLCEANKQSRRFPWPPVLALCRWVLQQPREASQRKVDDADLETGWAWTRKTIAELLSSGFASSASEVPFQLRASSWEVLYPLTKDPDPTPEAESIYGGSNMGPAIHSINTVRGEAMHAVIRYALWVRRHIELAPHGEEIQTLSFDELPEVRDVLDFHLDSDRDPSMAIRAVYGQWFPWLVLLDSAWAEQSLSKIFPARDDLHNLRDAAWETYLVFCGVYDGVFSVLEKEYHHAVDRIDEVQTQQPRMANPDQRLAEHLMILFWRGELEIDDPGGLLARFYEKAPDRLRDHTLEFVGRSLWEIQGEVSPPVLDRLRALWTSRIGTAKNSTSKTSHTSEMAAFGWWFSSGKFDEAWALTQLKSALELSGRVDHHNSVVERLSICVRTMPELSVECLGLMVDGDEERWTIFGWLSHARTVLAVAIQSPERGAREAATDLIHRLGTLGFRDLRDVLSTVE